MRRYSFSFAICYRCHPFLYFSYSSSSRSLHLLYLLILCIKLISRFSDLSITYLFASINRSNRYYYISFPGSVIYLYLYLSSFVYFYFPILYFIFYLFTLYILPLVVIYLFIKFVFSCFVYTSPDPINFVSSILILVGGYFTFRLSISSSYIIHCNLSANYLRLTIWVYIIGQLGAANSLLPLLGA